MAVLPSDHFIADTEKYHRVVRAALEVAREPGRMVVLGIPPTRPETGFGYVERMGDALHSLGFPVYAVRRFTEKPALAISPNNTWPPVTITGTRGCFSGASRHFSKI